MTQNVPNGIIPVVQSYNTLNGKSSVVEQYTEKVLSKKPVSYPGFKTDILQKDFNNFRIDFIIRPEKYKKLLQSAGKFHNSGTSDSCIDQG